MLEDNYRVILITAVIAVVCIAVYQVFKRFTLDEKEDSLMKHARGKANRSWAIDPNKKAEEFRNYEENPRQERVRKFYQTQHENMTYEFVMKQREKHLKFDKCEMTVWDMLHYLDNVVDDSDPDTDLSQLEHAVQAAEAARAQYPSEEYDWLHVTALIHDLGKILAVTDDKLGLVGDEQWCVVGDNFPVGCAFAEENIFYEYFKNNSDYNDNRYNTKYGIYNKEDCERDGLMSVILSWGHDEYLYQICKSQSKLPIEALYMIRYHSFYPWHCKGGYRHLCNEFDIKTGLEWVKKFNKFDLYSKSTECASFEEVKDYYQEKIEKYFPNVVRW